MWGMGGLLFVGNGLSEMLLYGLGGLTLTFQEIFRIIRQKTRILLCGFYAWDVWLGLHLSLNGFRIISIQNVKIISNLIL